MNTGKEPFKCGMGSYEAIQRIKAGDFGPVEPKPETVYD
jgi:hypothetical protein